MSAAADLLTPAGAELLDRLRGATVTPERALRLAEELRGRYPAELVAAALTQQRLRTAAREKFSRADDMLFTRAGLEQASAETVASHSASRFRGLSLVADLCCGIGGDLMALATSADQVLAVDADPDALRFARRNVAVQAPAAARVSFVRADVRDLPAATLRGLAGAYIDPARRTGDRRLRTGDSEPPLDWCVSLADQVERVAIKTAPGLPRDLVPDRWEAEFVAVGRALKEAVLWSPGLASTSRRATILPAGDTLTAATEAEPAPESKPVSESEPVRVANPGRYLLDPNPAVTRAGLVQELARHLDAWQIDPMIAFLSVDNPVATPFARTLRVLESMPWHEKRVAAKLRELGVGSADIRRRGLAGDVQQIHKRLGLRGDKSAIIVMTRHEARPWCLICTDVGSGYSSGPGAGGGVSS